MKKTVRRIALMSLVAAPAKGQTSALLDCGINAACEASYAQSHQQSKAGQPIAVEQRYKLAHEVSHDVRLPFKIARVLDKREQSQEAETYYRTLVETPLEDEARKAMTRTYLALESKAPTPTPLPETPAAISSTMIPSGEQNAQPVYREGWFWGMMVGCVASLGLGIGLGVGLSNRGPSAPNTMVPNGTNTIVPNF